MHRYFEPLLTCKLPSPYGNLSKCLPPSSIKEVNKKVEAAISKHGPCKRLKRQAYQKISSEMKAKVAKYAAENGIKAAVCKFRSQVPSAPSNWNNTVRD